MTIKCVSVSVNTFAGGYTTTPGSELGLFRIRGYNLQLPLENHQFILQDVQDWGHHLLVHVFYGGREHLVVENASDPASDAVFSFKHPGTTKKSFKPGEILTHSESYTLTWMGVDRTGHPQQLITLYLTPRYSVHGLRLLYTMDPIKK